MNDQSEAKMVPWELVHEDRKEGEQLHRRRIADESGAGYGWIYRQREVTDVDTWRSTLVFVPDPPATCGHGNSGICMTCIINYDLLRPRSER